ncbi:MAG: ribosome-associated translation inhibitor RaiA [Desulfovibrio sp.]|nr:MAG: ribosome-associated translation inhibitor RaiA [Desulfovibrio sp.]
MNISFTFKNFDPSDHLKDYAARRFEKIAKYMDDKAETMELQANLAVEKHRHMAEVILSGDYLHVSAYEESGDMYATIDLVLDKLEAQVRKMREKTKSRRKGGKEQRSVRMDVISFQESDAGRERTIVESDHFKPKPMDIDEAAMQLDTLDYEFLVFRNAETERINVIYHRKDGDFGLIDPGM